MESKIHVLTNRIKLTYTRTRTSSHPDNRRNDFNQNEHTYVRLVYGIRTGVTEDPCHIFTLTAFDNCYACAWRCCCSSLSFFHNHSDRYVCCAAEHCCCRCFAFFVSWNCYMFGDEQTCMEKCTKRSQTHTRKRSRLKIISGAFREWRATR